MEHIKGSTSDDSKSHYLKERRDKKKWMIGEILHLLKMPQKRLGSTKMSEINASNPNMNGPIRNVLRLKNC